MPVVIREALRPGIVAPGVVVAGMVLVRIITIQRARRVGARVGTYSAALLVMAVCLLSGCNAGGPSPAQGQNLTGKNSSVSPAQDSAGQASGPNRCELLTDDEIRDAIGPHQVGKRWSQLFGRLESCRWTATTAQQIEGHPNWFDSIEVVVYEKNPEYWARQAKGDPVKGFAEGALYDRSYGDLWFNCPSGRFCVVKMNTAAGETREQIALRLARLVERRLR